MEIGEEKTSTTSSYKLYFFTKCYQNPSIQEGEKNGGISIPGNSKSNMAQPRQPAGWKAMPFILGNETFERLGTFGLMANFMVYLMIELHMDQVSASNTMSIWFGLSNFAPLVGAFISDTHAGRFKTIAFASFAAFLGMATVTLTAWLPSLHPPPCKLYSENCRTATSHQLAVLFTGLGLLSIGTGGIRPCSIPFGVDQFDPTTEKGLRGINSYYNWYYATFTVVILITLTLVVYIQDSISWVLGFGIPTVLMFCSIIVFFVGTRIYVYAKPQGSIFSSIAQVLVAAYKKRKLKIPDHGDEIDGIFYDPPSKGLLSKFPLTTQFRFLNKATMIEEGDLNPDSYRVNQWRLCSIQQIEEVKCLLKVGQVWASGIISFTAVLQQGTFTVSQAMKMDRHLGHKFQIPPGSISVFSMITIATWLPVYDRIIVPALRKITNHESGITLLQRIGIGIVFSILTMAVSGVVEMDRRAAAISKPRGAAMSVLWLVPQLVLMGLCEAFNIIGHIEFYNKEFPDHMRSIANSLFFASFGVASYFNALMTTIVHESTRTPDRPSWLTKDLNAGRLDYFYFILAGLGVLNLFYFLFVASRYRYKSPIQKNGKSCHDVETSSREKVSA